MRPSNWLYLIGGRNCRALHQNSTLVSGPLATSWNTRANHCHLACDNNSQPPLVWPPGTYQGLYIHVCGESVSPTVGKLAYSVLIWQTHYSLGGNPVSHKIRHLNEKLYHIGVFLSVCVLPSCMGTHCNRQYPCWRQLVCVPVKNVYSKFLTTVGQWVDIMQFTVSAYSPSHGLDLPGFIYELVDLQSRTPFPLSLVIMITYPQWLWMNGILLHAAVSSNVSPPSDWLLWYYLRRNWNGKCMRNKTKTWWIRIRNLSHVAKSVYHISYHTVLV